MGLRVTYMVTGAAHVLNQPVRLVLISFQYQLQIWDTAGQEKFRSITQSYYRAANALILVYDTCSQSTFDTLPQWMIDVENFAKHKVLAYLVGKCIGLDNHNCSKVLNTFLFLFSNKMWVIKAGIHKMLVRIASRQTLFRQCF